MIAINSIITSMQYVKILALSADGFKLNIIVDILRCLPCLEKIYITVKSSVLILVFCS
jgi:hypothetical protein